MRARLTALLTLAVAAAGTASAAPRRVGVVVSLRVNVEAEQATRVASVIGSAIYEKLDVEVVAGPAARARLPEKLPETCIAEPACLADLGRRLDVDELLMVAMVSLSPETLQLDVTWVSVATGAQEGREMLEVDPANPAAAIAAHVRKWLPDAPLRAAKNTPGVAPPTVDVPAHPPAQEGEVSTGGGYRVPRSAWIAGGATGGALALGTTFAMLARSQFNDLDESCPDSCDKGGLAVKNGLADGLFAASAVGAGLTIYFLLTAETGNSSPSDSNPAGSLSVGGDRDGFAVSYSGAF